MQTVRPLSIGTAEIGRVLPANPVGEELFDHRRRGLPAPVDERYPDRETASPHRADRLPPLHGEAPRLPRPLSGSLHPGGPAQERWLPAGASLTREGLLTSASFQAQHLGQVPPYQNEALMRETAAGAYREASGLSVQYLGAFQPIDIRV